MFDSKNYYKKYLKDYFKDNKVKWQSYLKLYRRTLHGFSKAEVEKIYELLTDTAANINFTKETK